MSQDTEQRLRAHVKMLAGTIGERNVFVPGTLERAADYLRGELKAAVGEVREQPYRTRGVEVRNLEAVAEGEDPSLPELVVGAHYDSVRGSPGANDNGSGVAALLEIARQLGNPVGRRTVRYAAFVNEEPPFFRTAEMGSRVYARRLAREQRALTGAVVLETIAYFSDRTGSQHYPPFFDYFYPESGNFIGFVSDRSSRQFMNRAVEAFQAATDFPVEHVAAPALVPGIDWSDHASFWKHGVPGFMITDTAPYRYPYYHSAEDTPEKLVYDRFAELTQGLAEMVRRLAAE